MAAYYPLPLIRAILKGISLQHAEDKVRLGHSRENRRVAQLAVYAARPAQVEIPVVKVLGKIKMNRTKGRAIGIMYDSSNLKTCDCDKYTGEILPLELVQAAMMEELNYFSEKTMRAAAEYSEIKANTDATFVRMRWVLCSKGDEKEPDVRARLVACEIAKDHIFTCQHPHSRQISFSLAAMRVKDPEPANRSN